MSHPVTTQPAETLLFEAVAAGCILMPSISQSTHSTLPGLCALIHAQFQCTSLQHAYAHRLQSVDTLVQHLVMLHVHCCRQRDSEIASLRTSLSAKDTKLQDSRSELAELHAQIKLHEGSLQQAYNQLAEASRDKARVRQQLLENQAELTGVRHTSSPSRCSPIAIFALQSHWLNISPSPSGHADMHSC